MRHIDLKTYFRDESRRNFLRDFLSLSGFVFLGGAELIRSSNVVIAGDENNDPDFGTIKGRIVFDGDPPPRTEVDLSKANLAAADMEWFKSTGPILNEDWVVDPKTKAVQWVYVWIQPKSRRDKLTIHGSLKEIDKDRKFVEVDQEPQGYVPHAVAIQEGQNLLMKNTGPIAHVFNLTAFRNDTFNKAMPPQAEIPVEGLEAESTPISINCPPHPWERMFLRVFDHPYFAVTKADGSFEIPFAPKGPCNLVVWQETLGFKGGRSGRNGSEITVEGGAITDLGDIKIKPS